MAKQDLQEVREKNILQKEIMSDKTKGEPLSLETYTAILKHLKKKNKNMFRHINKAVQYKTKISILTPMGETDGATIMNGKYR